MNDRILVVEDDPDVRRGLALQFRTLGYDAETAADAREAIAAAHRRRPDLVLLDIELGAGGDGFTVLHGFRADPVLRNVPVIVVTGHKGTDAVRRALDAGVDAAFEKPVEPAALHAAVVRHLAIRGARRIDLVDTAESSLWLG
jgi:CheY-like chemotaxis protein